MINYRRNSASGIIILFFLFFMLTFIHKGQERQNTRPNPSSVISDLNSSGHAIVSHSISVQGINLFRITPNSKVAYLDFISGRELIFNNLVSSSYNSCRIKFQSGNPIQVFFLQKIPEQGKEDDIVSIA